MTRLSEQSGVGVGVRTEQRLSIAQLQARLADLFEGAQSEASELARLGFSPAWREQAQAAHAALAGAQVQAGGDVLAMLGVLASADHLLATRLLCPRCERPMRWDWGWCPYHATPRELRVDLSADDDGSGEVTREEFVALVEDERPYVGQSFADHLTSDLGSRTRLLVHYTEFLAARRPVLVSEDEA